MKLLIMLKQNMCRISSIIFLNQNVHSKSVEDIIKIISEMIICYR